MDIARLMRPLTGLALVSLLMAVSASMFDRKVNKAPPPQLLLPDYAAQITAATRLEMTHGMGISGTRSIIVTQKNNQWVLPHRQDYPANQELVTETLLALADVKAVEARTARAQWHKSLGLVVPEDLGRAVRFKVSDDKGGVLTSFLLGREQQSEAEAKQEVKNYGPELRQFYARREDEAQSWLARGRLPRNANPAAWMDAALPKHDLAALQAVHFDAPSGAYALLRVTPDSWSMAGGEDWLAGFAALRPDDVTPAETINFDTAQHMRLDYKDGLRITYANVGAATVIWAGISAEAEADASDDVKAKMRAINARYGGWALRFDASRAPVLLPGRALLER
jgi:hypothetical protein